MYRKSISSWAEKYGSATTFSFMLYTESWNDEVTMLGNSMNISLYSEGLKSEFQILVEEIDTDKALALNNYRGTSLQFVFPNTVLHLEELVKETVDIYSDALAIKYSFLGSKEVVNLA